MEGMYLRRAQFMPQLDMTVDDQTGCSGDIVPSLHNERAAVPSVVSPLHSVSLVSSVSLSPAVSEGKHLPFIEANTQELSFDQLRDDCIVPVFSKDNELTISHQNFIGAVRDAAVEIFGEGMVSEPQIRVSHPIKGRIPEAVHKPAKELLESDKTVFYERMMFCMDIPSVHGEVAGNTLSLQIGGVRAYNEQNLGTKKTAEKFKLFIGFKNMVCCNMCVCSDGYVDNLKAMDSSGIYSSALELFRNYDMESHLTQMRHLVDFSMSDSQFAQFIGRCRLYNYLPSKERKVIPELLMTDTQIGLVAKAYYEDENFRKGEGSRVTLWQVFNYLTEANKSSYIDNFLDRSQNAMKLSEGICRALHGDAEYSWFLS